jgi:hypothetical protein
MVDSGLTGPEIHRIERKKGALTPEKAQEFRGSVEAADAAAWSHVVEGSGLADVQPTDLRTVFRQMPGLSA